MDSNIFSSLDTNAKYLLAIYTLFNAEGSEIRQVKDAMSTLTGKPFVDMKLSVGVLREKGLLVSGAYNWRIDTYDYYVSSYSLIPSMIFLYREEKELTIAVLDAARMLKPTAVQRMLWKFISSDFTNVALEDMDDREVYSHLSNFIPAVADSRFAPLIMLFSANNFSGLLESFFNYAFSEEILVDATYLRSLISGYNAADNAGTKISLVCLCDLYRYLSDGTRPHELLAGDPHHRIIAAISEAYKGNGTVALGHFKKALALQNRGKTYSIRKTNYFSFGIVNFFYVLISYMTEGEEGRRAALGVYKAVENSATLPGKVLYDILFDGATTNKIRSRLAEAAAGKGRMERALATLMCHYTENDVPLETSPQWLVLKHEMRRYCPIDAMSEVKANTLYGMEGLLTSIYRKQEWENVLEELSGKSSFSKQSEDKDSRLAYFMGSISDDKALVKMQTRLKNGSWSAGKSVGMTNFFDCTLPEMLPADIRIAAAGRKDSVFGMDVDVKHILPEMTENSRLYVGTRIPYTLVEVTEEMPYINLLRTSDGFEVSSNVPVGKINDGVMVVHTGVASINFIRLTPQQQHYYRRLLSLRRFPIEAEEPLRNFLKGIGGKIEVNSDLIEGGSTLPVVEGKSQLVAQMRPQDKEHYAVSIFIRPLEGGRIRCKPGVGNEIIIDCAEGNRYTRVRRNLAEECENIRQLMEETGIDREAVDGMAVLFAGDMLPIVEYAQRNPDIISCEWPEGARVNIRYRGATAWNGAIKKTDNGWFEIEGTVEIEQGKVVTMAQLLDLVGQSRGRFITLSDGEYLSLSEKLRKQLSRLNAIASRSHGKLQMSPFSAALLGADLLDGELRLTEDDELKKIRRRIKEASTYSPKVPETLTATLRKYQQEGYKWMSRLNKWGAGALLADDMGLGKTIQTITFLLAKAAEGPSLVVAPASVAPNWKMEFDKFAPSLNVVILNFAEDRQAVVREAKAGDVVITTYGLLLSVKDFLVKKHWNTICLDEAHIIKNRGAKTSAVAMQLKGDNRIMLTGTPVQNHLGELWNLFQFVNPGLLGSFEDFNRRFIVPIEQFDDKTRQGELDRLVKPFMLRRTKDKVAKELPEKEEIYQHVTMAEEEMLIYEVMRRKAEAMLIAEGTGRVSMTTLAEITRLRQCSCDVRLVEEGRRGGSGGVGSKITALIELLQTITEGFTVDSKGKMHGGALVFSQFTSYLALIRLALDEIKMPYLYIDGSTDIKTRQRLVAEFQDGACPVFLISLKAGGLGLNLTRANYVIHMDPWWNPAIEAQATDRAHRIGQKQSVTVYHLIAEGTIEEKIQRLHERKQALVQSILESTDMSHRLTGEELLEMLRT